MNAWIHVINHIPELIGLDDVAFADRVDALKQRLGQGEPLATLVRRSVGAAMASLEEAPDRDELQERLLGQDPVQITQEALHQVTTLLPPMREPIICHLFPNGGNRGSGLCFGDDRIIVAAPCRGDAASWIRFVVAHEYSHTHRGFGEHEPDTVRKDLVFEGLAMVFAETVFSKPTPYPWVEVTAEQEKEYWAGVDLNAQGLEAVSQHKSDISYATGTRIVRAYLDRHGVSIEEAHRLSNEELYWESGYPLLQ